jgi:hypothetical protein
MAGALTISTLNNDTGVLQTQNGMTGIAKAWVYFAGATASINNSFNVSSVTRNGTGDYTVSFTVAMANTNYCCVGSNINGNASNNFSLIIGNAAGGATTGSCRFGAIQSGATTAQDPANVNFVVFGN